MRRIDESLEMWERMKKEWIRFSIAVWNVGYVRREILMELWRFIKKWGGGYIFQKETTLKSNL